MNCVNIKQEKGRTNARPFTNSLSDVYFALLMAVLMDSKICWVAVSNSDTTF